jgi:hypothetical protein
LARAHNSDIPKFDRLEFTAGMGGLMALFRHIAFHQTGPLDLSHGGATFDMMALGSSSVCSISRHCLRPPSNPLRFPRLGSENGSDGSRLCTIIFFLFAPFTPQRHIRYRDDSATAANPIAGGFSSVVGMIRKHHQPTPPLIVTANTAFNARRFRGSVFPG